MRDLLKKYSTPLLIIFAVAVIGSIWILYSHAATSSVSFEAESSTLTSPATKVNESSASGGSAIQFGSVGNLGSVNPIWSDLFNQSIGVNTHLKDSGGDNAIYADKTTVTNMVQMLGVRNIREKMVNNTNQNTARSLLSSSGVKWHVTLLDISDYASVMSSNTLLDGLFTKIASEPQLYVSVANANEPNNGSISDWATKVAQMQQKIYERKAAISATLSGQQKANFDAIKIVGPALKYNVPNLQLDFQTLGAASPKISQYLDYGDIHLYPSGLPPTTGLANIVSWASAAYGGKKLYMTETGYNNGINLWNNGMPIPENASALYAPEHFLDNFDFGFAKTFVYELLNSPSGSTSNPWEENFGLVDTPTASPGSWIKKPSFNEISTLSIETKDAGSVYNPPSIRVNVTVQNNDPSMKKIYMSKRDGSSYMAVWRDIKVYNPIKGPTAGWPGSLINVGTVNVTVETSNGSLSVPIGNSYRWVQLYPTLQILK